MKNTLKTVCGVVALSAALVACGNGTADSEPEANGIATAEQMCDRLTVLDDRGLSAADAYNTILAEDLAGLTGPEIASFAELLITAPSTACPQHLDYAAAIHYWVL